jgi:hypothetical protein
MCLRDVRSGKEWQKRRHKILGIRFNYIALCYLFCVLDDGNGEVYEFDREMRLCYCENLFIQRFRVVFLVSFIFSLVMWGELVYSILNDNLKILSSFYDMPWVLGSMRCV